MEVMGTPFLRQGRFWPAEAYHQGYFDANPYPPYCMGVIAPKVRKVMEKFAAH